MGKKAPQDITSDVVPKQEKKNKRKDADPAAEKTALKASVIVDEEILGLKRSLDFQNLSDIKPKLINIYIS
jgi:hypothetical protein